MANSIQKIRGASVAPLGFVPVPTPGNAVSVMSVNDPGNNNAPTTSVTPGSTYGAEQPYPVSVRGVGFQAYRQASNNTPPVFNQGQIYILVAPSPGGSGNNIDTGCLVKVLQPGEDYFYPPPEANLDRISPYYLYLDADNAGDGAICVGYSAGGG